jgi:hypothetical protein
VIDDGAVIRTNVLGDIIHEYEPAARPHVAIGATPCTILSPQLNDLTGRRRATAQAGPDNCYHLAFLRISQRPDRREIAYLDPSGIRNPRRLQSHGFKCGSDRPTPSVGYCLGSARP